jgi:hypothetical protein
LRQHFLRSVKFMCIRHFRFFLRTIITLANHCEYVTSLINPASNRRCTSAFAVSIFSSDILRSFYFLGFAFGLTCSLCSITCLLTPIKLEVDQAKTSLFLFRNCRSFTCSSRLIVTPRCYCSSYIISIVASTVFIQWWLQYEPNSMKMVFSTNGVGSF